MNLSEISDVALRKRFSNEIMDALADVTKLLECMRVDLMVIRAELAQIKERIG